jgi:hypothetical protein
MIKSILAAAAVLGLAACGQSADDGAAKAAANAAAAEKPRSAYCFFKDDETKEWSAARGADGNIVVKGKAFRQDSRYQAVLGEAQASGATARIGPSIIQNATGFAAPDNWWDLSASIPDSAAVETVRVECGAKLLAELKVPRAA